MKDAVRRVGAVALALVIVTTAALSGVGGPASPVQTASAEWVECDFSDPLLGAAYNTLTGADSGCRWDAGDETDVENLTATNAYSNALGMKDSVDSYTTTTGNFMENTRTVAYSKGKITLVNELNNGTSVSAANSAVNTSVRDYYSRMQAEIVKDWNAKMYHVQYLVNSSNATVHVDTGASVYAANEHDGYLNATVTLANGTTMNTIGPRVGNPTDGFVPVKFDTGYSDYSVLAEDPETGDRTEIINPSDYEPLHTDAENQSAQVVANLDPYTDEVYAQYAAGEINSTDLAMNDPAVIGNEASTSLNSTGYYGHAAIMLASLGAGGNVNVSHTIETGDGTTLNGTLYYTGDDADGWDTNTTYTLSDYNGTFYAAIQKDDGTAGIVDLSNYGGNFTLTQATNTKTGETVNTTTVHRYTYDSTNASALQEEIDRLEQLRQEYQNQQDSGGSGWGLGTEDKAIVVAAIVALILVSTRN